MLKAINAVLISSAQPQVLIDFYTKLGVALKIENHGSGVHAEAEFGDVHFAIWSGGGPKVERNNVCFSFHVPNLEEYYEQLVAKGIVFTQAPQPLPFGGVTAALQDPDGNRIVLMRWKSDK